MTRRIFIALGSNIEPEKNLPEAIKRLAARVTLVRTSRVYRSAALDSAGQPDSTRPDFLNAAVLIETDLPPYNLKFTALRAVEAELGRVRTADKIASRTIDLDLALYGSLVLDDPDSGLVLPDPSILTQAHVVLPLADLDPEFVHPLTGETLSEIAARLHAASAIQLTDLKLDSHLK